MSETKLQGLIIKAQSGFFTVEMSPSRESRDHGDASQGFVVCQLRGKLKQGKATGDIAALGDKVRVTVLEDGSGVIEEVEKRKRALVRLDPRPQGEYQQVLLANADQAIFVFACAHPSPRATRSGPRLRSTTRLSSVLDCVSSGPPHDDGMALF